MPTFIQLIGLPASGKSTWRENYLANRIGPVITASSDDYIDWMCDRWSLSYNDGFKQFVDDAQKHVEEMFRVATRYELDLLHDQTNMSVKSRRAKLQWVPKHYHKIAVVVKCKDPEEWNRRMLSRPGKTIPAHVIRSMADSYQEPTTEEGFDEVQFVFT